MGEGGSPVGWRPEVRDPSQALQEGVGEGGRTLRCLPGGHWGVASSI